MLGANSDREQAGWSQVFKFWDSDVSEPEYYKQEQKARFLEEITQRSGPGSPYCPGGARSSNLVGRTVEMSVGHPLLRYLFGVETQNRRICVISGLCSILVFDMQGLGPGLRVGLLFRMSLIFSALITNYSTPKTSANQFIYPLCCLNKCMDRTLWSCGRRVLLLLDFLPSGLCNDRPENSYFISAMSKQWQWSRRR